MQNLQDALIIKLSGRSKLEKVKFGADGPSEKSLSDESIDFDV